MPPIKDPSFMLIPSPSSPKQKLKSRATPSIQNPKTMHRSFDHISSLAFFLLLLLLLLLSRPGFAARLLPDPMPLLAANATAENTTWHGFAKFLDVGKGAEVPGMSELKKYFNHFGYLSVPDSNLSDVFDGEFQSALIAYQTRLGLPVTGKLDSDTVSTITTPRCGMSDAASPHGLHTTRHFAFFYGKPRWARGAPATLTYAFSPSNMISYLTTDEVRAAFQGAFARWAAVIPMSFEEVEDYEAADVRIGFYHGSHGDGEPFDGVLGVLAHAFSPENGRFHLDAAETWAVDFGRERSKVAVDLESVATHEIGHVLGLAHSSVKEAVMYPSLSPRARKVDLRIDDVEGVQALYGSNPDFKLSSFLQSEESSDSSGGLGTRLSRWTASVPLLVLLSFLSC